MKQFLIILCTAIALQGQVFSEYSFGAADAAGSGGSQGAVISSVWSCSQNPAGYAGLRSPAAAVGQFRPAGQSFSRWISFAAAMPLRDKWGSIALNGDQSAVDYGGRQYGSESALALTHAFILQKDIRSSLRFGYSIRYLSVDYGQSAGLSGDGSDGVDLGGGSVMAVDVGLQGSLRERTWVGVTLRNINSPELGNSTSGSPLPRKITAALAYSPYWGLVSSFAVDKELGNDFQYRAGLDYRLNDRIALRSGVSTYPSQLTLGAAVNWKYFIFDYAFITHPVLPAIQMFNLSFYLKQ